jgi:putative ABC transport system substrate-binding protein
MSRFDERARTVSRRRVLAFMAASLAAPARAGAQGPARIVLVTRHPPNRVLQQDLDTLRAGLRAHGWIPGQDLTIEERWWAIHPSPDPSWLELEGVKIHAAFALGDAGLRLVRHISRLLPTVAVLATDADNRTLFGNPARPVGPTTGFALSGPAFVQEQRVLLSELFPAARSIAVLWEPSDGGIVRLFNDTLAAVQPLGLRARSLEVVRADQLDVAIAETAAQEIDVLLVLPSVMALALRPRLISLAERHRLPVLYPLPEFAEAGGLVAYGPSLRDTLTRSAGYLDRLLRGARVSDLSADVNLKRELVVNQRTAAALGIALPSAVLQRADRVVQ